MTKAQTVSGSQLNEARSGSNQQRDRFRPELEGLRAFAVLMVVTYHIWLDRVSGGVDIFLMVSAFLLTLSFVRRAERHQSLNLTSHWLRRFRRLLPAAAATIVVTLVAANFVYPRADLGDLVRQGWASLFYWENWQLISVATDYFGAEAALQSPLQHFWSLSIQGQVFILWPLVFVLATAIAKKLGKNAVSVLAAFFVTIFVASLTWSIISTQQNQAVAYFDTFARLWEFAFGSLLAIFIGVFDRMPVWLRVVIGWAGLLSMLAVGITVDVSRGFPGWVALWPMVSAAAVMIAGATNSAFGVDRVLTTPLLQYCGRISYSLYLIHWPILSLYRARVERHDISIMEGAGVILLSFIAASLLHAFIEQPVRNLRGVDSSTWKQAATIGVTVAVAVCAILPVRQTAVDYEAALEDERQQRIDEAAQALKDQPVTASDHPGAAVLASDYPGSATDFAVTPAPSPDLAARDWEPQGTACDDFEANQQTLDSCQRTVINDDPSRVVWVIGDSHSAQLLSSIVPIGYAAEWDITLFQAADLEDLEDSDRVDNPDFVAWIEAVTELTLEEQPDVVITMGTQVLTSEEKEILNPGFQKVVDRFNAAGIEVVAFRDNPRFETSMLTCAVEQHPTDPSQCAVPATEIYADTNPLDEVTGESFAAVDLSPYYCPDGMCSAVVGNVYVYVDAHHITATYGRSLAPFALEELSIAVEWPELDF